MDALAGSRATSRDWRPLGTIAPVDKLGLIVVDEEHDSSFRTTKTGCAITHATWLYYGPTGLAQWSVLGSATPSLEASFWSIGETNAQDPNNRYLKEIEHPPAAASTTPLYQRQPRLGTAPLASLAEHDLAALIMTCAGYFPRPPEGHSYFAKPQLASSPKTTDPLGKAPAKHEPLYRTTSPVSTRLRHCAQG